MASPSTVTGGRSPSRLRRPSQGSVSSRTRKTRHGDDVGDDLVTERQSRRRQPSGRVVARHTYRRNRPVVADCGSAGADAHRGLLSYQDSQYTQILLAGAVRARLRRAIAGAASSRVSNSTSTTVKWPSATRGRQRYKDGASTAGACQTQAPLNRLRS